MSIIVDSIKDKFIPQVSSKKTPNKMYDALSRMYEERNISRKMNLRDQLKGILICHSDLVTENTVSQRIQTDNHKIGKIMLQWK